jgi:1-acyl-sn-glycerol-3-phosphate acyltransferase
MAIIPESELPSLIEKNKYIYEEYYDRDFIANVTEALALIDRTYFRIRYVGFGNLPERRHSHIPLIYASNHSGMAFPWDAILFGMGLIKKHKGDFTKGLRALTAPMLSQSVLMNLFLMPNVWKKGGGIDATTLNFETMMHYPDGELLIYPEGVPGIGKGFNNKYKLQRFSTSFVRMALKYDTDIVPFATVNGEYINPYTYSYRWINRIFQRIGIPFLPIGIITIMVLIQPWFFYTAWPANLVFVLGKRINPRDFSDKPFHEMTREDFGLITQKVKEEMQIQLSEAEKQWGRKPFKWKDFWQLFFKNIKDFPFNMPFGWPLLFAEFERQYYKKKQRPVKLNLNFFSVFRIMIQNPITLAYYIPIVGWIPLLIKGYRNNTLGKQSD